MGFFLNSFNKTLAFGTKVLPVVVAKKLLLEMGRVRSMGRGLSNQLADTTKPGCRYVILYIALFVKTILNFENINKCSII